MNLLLLHMYRYMYTTFLIKMHIDKVLTMIFSSVLFLRNLINNYFVFNFLRVDYLFSLNPRAQYIYTRNLDSLFFNANTN